MREMTTLEQASRLWCGLMHDAAMWPMHGQYECRTCGRHYPVPWREEKSQPRAAGLSVGRTLQIVGR
jgi:hypothetical protein